MSLTNLREKKLFGFLQVEKYFTEKQIPKP